MDCSANPVRMTVMTSATTSLLFSDTGALTTCAELREMAVCVSEPSSSHDKRRMWPTLSMNSRALHRNNSLNLFVAQ